MFRGAYSYLKILTACLIPLVSACVVIPLGSEIDQGQIIEFHPGITHRFEVIEQIGEPNIFSGSGFDVYHLKEGQFAILFFPTQQGVDGAEEIYNLVFHYDAKGLLQELRYEKSLDPNDPDLILLDNDFTGRVKDFTADGEYSSVYISADGRLITAISETSIVIQEVEGESREIELEQMNLDSWGYGLDCVIDLYNHRRKKQNPDFNWLIGIQDLRPLYWLCMTKGAFGVRAKGAYGVTADGSGLAVSNSNQIELLLQTGDVVSAPEADQAPIRGIWFDGMENHVVTSSTGFEIRFMQDSLVKTEIKIRSLPSLNTIESIRRPFGVTATAMSDDNRLFALASGSHVELWRRIKDPGESSASDGHYELTRIIPKKPGKGFSGTKYLNFSPDGEYLMAVGSWAGKGDLNGRIYLWDMDDGRPVAEIAQLDGFIEAGFNQNNEIVIVSGQESWNITSRKYQSLKIWHLPLDIVRGNKGKTPSPEAVTPVIAATTDKGKAPSPEAVTPAIEATTDKVRNDIDISGTYISEITSNSIWQLTKKYQKLRITFTQKGNQISGVDKKFNTKIEATIVGDVLNFYVIPGQATGGYDVEGEWKISADGTRFEGTWKAPNSADSAAGKWILNKVE